jgi:hypothetical protein
MRWANGSEPAAPELGDLYRGISRYLARPEPADSEQLRGEMADLRHIQDLIDLKFSRQASKLEAMAREEEEMETAYHWIRHACKVSGSTASDRLRIGELEKQLGASVEAMVEGEIGFAHLTVIARATELVGQSRTAEGPLSESVLLKHARECSPGKLWYFCQKARHMVDPEGMAEEQLDQQRRRSLELSEFEDGGLAISGCLDPVGGATLRTALEPLARPAGADDQRRRPQRLADGLVELAAHALDSGVVRQTASQRPHLQVTTTLESLRRLPGAPASDLEYSVPVSYRTVDRLACDSTVSRILLNSESVVVDVGRARRVVSSATRRALNARDGSCRWPECERPASWSAAHHLKHWAQGGETNLDNLVLLCHRHHAMVHEGSWQLVPTENGFEAIPPPLDYQPSARSPDEFEAA